MTAAEATLAFVWDNFGPLHARRCDAVAALMGPRTAVLGVEIFARSKTYDWVPEGGEGFEKITLFPEEARQAQSWAVLAWRLLAALRRGKARHVFLCHYQKSYILLSAIVLRLMGRRVYFMGDSKFDDQPRFAAREVLKCGYLLPYHGALTAGLRSRDYLRFLGFRKRPLALGYDTVSVARIQDLAGSAPAPDGAPFRDRHFTVVARLVPEKNIGLVLEALALLVRNGEAVRRLVVCGSGPLEARLRTMAADLGLTDLVEFRGFLQAEETSRVLARSLCLILPSTNETFGQVIAEAQAMGLPVIVSEPCGARDELVRTGVNGFVVEADNVRGLARAMAQLSHDELLWTDMATATQEFRPLADVARFAEAVAVLTGLEPHSEGAGPQ